MFEFNVNMQWMMRLMIFYFFDIEVCWLESLRTLNNIAYALDEVFSIRVRVEKRTVFSFVCLGTRGFGVARTARCSMAKRGLLPIACGN